MVVLNKIYTRTGDKGDTALGNGERVAKHNARVEAYGTSDELNCFVGVARLDAKGETDAALSRIQNDLFDLGADLCRASSRVQNRRASRRTTDGFVDRTRKRQCRSCEISESLERLVFRRCTCVKQRWKRRCFMGSRC